MSSKVNILIDSDVLIHLFKADRVTLLDQLYKGRLKMLDIVLNELRNNRTINTHLDGIFRFSTIEEIPFPTTSNEKMFGEYLTLKKTIKGNGERATLLFCKYNQHIIASSNTSDTIPYCTSHSIEYLTTLDIMCVAENRKLITKSEANQMIKLILSKDSYLCCNSIEDHLKNHFDPKKLLF